MNWHSLIFGKLGWDAIPFNEPIPLVASAVIAVAILSVLGWVWRAGHFPYLWREWITSVDHKRTVLVSVMVILPSAAVALLSNRSTQP